VEKDESSDVVRQSEYEVLELSTDGGAPSAPGGASRRRAGVENDESSGGVRQSEYEVLELSTDGGARGNPGPAAIGAVVMDPSTAPPRVLAEVSERIGIATNNVAEYRALIAGLDAAARFGSRRLLVRADSLLLIQQLKGIYKVKHPNLKPLVAEAHRKLAWWSEVELRHVPRAQNRVADALVNRALDAPAAHEHGRA
jgi:ribonuclease HI